MFWSSPGQSNVLLLALVIFQVMVGAGKPMASHDKTMLYTIGNVKTAHHKKIFQLSCDDIKKCQWTEMVTKLKERRHGAVAFPISNELTKKICN